MRRRIALAVVGAALGVLAIAPSGASAAPPAGCTQTDASNPAAQPSEWTCIAGGPGTGTNSDGSVTVSGYEVTQNGIGSLPKPPVNGHITHMEVDVVDQDAQPVPISRLMLHHIVFFNGNRSDAACGGPERFYGAGEERMKMSFPAPYGYPLDPANNWALVYMYMNHRAQTDSAWIQYKISVDPSPGMQDLRSYWMDVGNCAADPIYNVRGIDQPPPPPTCKKVGKNAKRGARRKAAKCRKLAKKRRAAREAMPTESTDVRSKDVTFKENGWIVAGAGHVHGGAKELTVTKPSCNSLQVANSVPTWGNPDHPFYNVKPVLHEPGPIGMSGFVTPTGIPVRQGQTLRLNSIYDNLQPHTRVMGIYVVYVATDPPGGPSPTECGGAPNDIVYGPGTNLPGRSTPPPFKIPLTGLDSSGNAVTIDGPPGAFKDLGALSGDVTVGTRFFSEPNLRVKPGTTLNYHIAAGESHNVTLANGPEGFGSPTTFGAPANFSQTFTRAGTYRIFCAWHPVQMHERVVVENPKAKKKKKKAKRKKH